LSASNVEDFTMLIWDKSEMARGFSG
jgi:hypothetical protein